MGMVHVKIITEGAEHHFLTFLDKLKTNPSGWIACTFPFSKRVNHDDLMSRRTHIKNDLARTNAEVMAFVESFKDRGDQLPLAHLFKFTDNDIMLLCCPSTEAEQKTAREILESASAQFPTGFCDYGFLTKELYVFQKIADHKFTTKKRMEAYGMLADEAAIESLSLRRKKRSDPVIMVVEDDRFTASYISNFLKDFDVIVARSGEEALEQYIEYAPDAVFLDIHMPGMDGHQTLQAIKCADPEAFVVMLSVDTARSSIMTASDNGAVSYLKKPFSRERVLNTLRLSPFIRESLGVLPIHRG